MFNILSASEIQAPVLAAIISVSGVLLTSIFGYVSSYYGNRQSQKNELKKIRENQQKFIEQENKLQKDKALRLVLQKLTYAYYNTDSTTSDDSTYFNTAEGQQIFYDVMSYVTAYASDQTVQTTIYMQKAINHSNLLQAHYSEIAATADNQLPQEIDWVRYETDAIASILIAQIRYDISGEFMNPHDLIVVKFNNNNPALSEFFAQGIDIFIQLLDLQHFNTYIRYPKTTKASH